LLAQIPEHGECLLKSVDARASYYLEAKQKGVGPRTSLPCRGALSSLVLLWPRRSFSFCCWQPLTSFKSNKRQAMHAPGWMLGLLVLVMVVIVRPGKLVSF